MDEMTKKKLNYYTKVLYDVDCQIARKIYWLKRIEDMNGVIAQKLSELMTIHFGTGKFCDQIMRINGKLYSVSNVPSVTINDMFDLGTYRDFFESEEINKLAEMYAKSNTLHISVRSSLSELKRQKNTAQKDLGNVIGELGIKYGSYRYINEEHEGTIEYDRRGARLV